MLRGSRSEMKVLGGRWSPGVASTACAYIVRELLDGTGGGWEALPRGERHAGAVCERKRSSRRPLPPSSLLSPEAVPTCRCSRRPPDARGGKLGPFYDAV